MDFLDPKKKKLRTIRLAIGHTLMGVIVVVGTFILVYQAYGFDVDRKTGEVIQNGLVFVDSAPDDAEIKINGEVNRSRTNTRLTLPEGSYLLEVNKAGYRPWSKRFELKGGSIERFTYPTLFSQNLLPSELRSFDSQVSFMTQSPDRRWIILGQGNSPANFIQYDLKSRQNRNPIAESLVLPSGLLTASAGPRKLEAVEWSTDNERLLAKHSFQGGYEFVVINRDLPAESFNVNKLFSVNPSLVKMRDKKVDRLYIYDGAKRTLSSGNTSTRQLESVQNNVISFQPHGGNIVAMALVNQDNLKRADLVIRENNKNYPVSQINLQPNIKVEIAQYDSRWYFAYTDPAAKKAYIYMNPVDFIKNNSGLKPAPVMVMTSKNKIDDLSFSKNTQFIAARAGQQFSVYDNEYERLYGYDIAEPFDKESKVEWMDGHRLTALSKGKVIVFEFDGLNKQTLLPATGGLPVFFDQDYIELYSLASSKASNKPVLQKTDLRLEADR